RPYRASRPPDRSRTRFRALFSLYRRQAAQRRFQLHVLRRMPRSPSSNREYAAGKAVKQASGLFSLPPNCSPTSNPWQSTRFNRIEEIRKLGKDGQTNHILGGKTGCTRLKTLSTRSAPWPRNISARTPGTARQSPAPRSSHQSWLQNTAACCSAHEALSHRQIVGTVAGGGRG